MARRSSLDLLLASRIAALTAAVPAALAGDAGAVHRARVASRRLREIAPVLEAVAPSARRAGAAVRRVTRALGPVRELDVTAGLCQAVVAASPVRPLAQAAVLQAVARERAHAVDAASRTLSATHGARLEAALHGLAEEVAGVRVAEVSAVVRTRVVKRADRTREALDRLGVLYAPERLHAVRIAVKQLRYALEIAGRLRCAPAATALRQLRAVQELLGRAHDLHVLAELVRRVESRLVIRSRAAARDLGRVARDLDEECRLIHASFLKRRDALRRLAVTRGTPPRRGQRGVAA